VISPVTPPQAKRVEHRREYHGDVFIDPYEWLRDKSDPEVIKHLTAENSHTEELTADLAPLRQQIFDEIKSRTKETDLSVPTRRGDWWYYGRSFEGKQYGVQCRCPVADPTDWTPPRFDEDTEIPGEQVLLDENVEAEGHDFFALGASSVSLDGNLLAYSVDVVGDERYTLRFKDLRTGERYPDEIAGIGAGVTWAADNQTVYYVTVDDAWRPDTVWRHRLGSRAADEQVYREADERFWLAVGRTRSDAYIVIAAGSAITSEVRYGDAADPGTGFTTVWPRRDGVEYSVEHAVVGGDDRFLIVHNDGAVNFELVEAPVENPSAHRTLIEHRDDVRIDGVDAFDGHLVVSYRREALPRIQLWPITADGHYGEPREISFDSELMSAGLGANPNWQSPMLRIGATSFLTPVRVYDLDVTTGERFLLREQPVLGDYRREDYVERRDWAVAADGARVPLSIIHRADLSLPAQALIYGYGAYELCEDPRFSIARLSLLDRGMVFVVAHVRGGGELGRLWYEQTAAQKEHFHRFRHIGHPSRRDRGDPAGEPRRDGRQRRWAADGRGGQPGPGVVRGDPGPGAVRRPVDDHTRPGVATDCDGVGRVGKSVAGPRRLLLHEVLLALRERGRQGLPADPRDDVAARHPRLLRRAREMGGRAALHENRHPPGAVEDRDERRSRRHQRPLRALARDRVPVRLAATRRRRRQGPRRPGIAAATGCAAAAACSVRARIACRPRRRCSPGTSRATV